jgi:hypothetical protein
MQLRESSRATKTEARGMSREALIDFGLVADKHALPGLERIAKSMELRFLELEKTFLNVRKSVEQ